MRLLDLYSCAGGATEGYLRAGFKEVVGVDIHAQPNYCGTGFIRGDVIELLNDEAWMRWVRREFDAVHASPPCQAYSALGSLSDNQHPDLLGPTRDLLDATGLPYVIENVPNAPMRRDYILCGSMFGLGALCHDGQYRQLRRHRWFEVNWPPGLQPQCAHDGEPVGVYGHGSNRLNGVGRGFKGNASESREAMDAPWMTKKECSQAIPPAFTHHIGSALMAHLRTEASPADPVSQQGVATCPASSSSPSSPRSS